MKVALYRNIIAVMVTRVVKWGKNYVHTLIPQKCDQCILVSVTVNLDSMGEKKGKET